MIKYLLLFLPPTQNNSRSVVIGLLLYLIGWLTLLTYVWYNAADIPGPWVWLWLTAITGLLFAVRWPQIGPLVYILVTYSVPRYKDPFYALTDLCLSEWIAYLAVSAALLFAFSKKTKLYKTDPLEWAMVGLCITLVLSAIKAKAMGLAWDPLNEDPLGQLNQTLILFFLGVSVLTTRTAMTALAGTVFLTLAIRIGLGGIAIVEGDHDIAFLIVMFLPFLLVAPLLIPNSIAGKLIMFLSSTPLLYALSRTHNRGAIVGLLGVCAILWLRSRRKLIGTAVGILLITGLYFIASPQPYLQGFSSMLSDQAVEGRFNVWQAALQMVRENPFLGVGLGNFQSQALVYGDNPVMGALVAHNNFLHIAGEGGLIALAFYLLLIGGAFIRCSQLCHSKILWDRTRGRVIEASLVGYVLTGLFLSRHNFAFAYLVIGIAVGIFAGLDKNTVSARSKKQELRS